MPDCGVTFGTREPSERDMKRKSGCGPGLIGLGLLIGFVFGEHYLAMYIDKRRFPWAYADSGRPLLVGTWVGAFTTRSGNRLAMLLDMQLVPLGRDEKGTPIIRTDRHGGWLEARVLVCDGPGRVRHLAAWGRPNDNQASRFHLGTSPTDSGPPPEGLAPSHIYGQWVSAGHRSRCGAERMRRSRRYVVSSTRTRVSVYRASESARARATRVQR